ncbi:MAG: hypothetical protein HUU50_10640 [Candidatus Brocadiae bacterium]|nr:hypothetical protein [Candidatus Brocadiia bacterium]
MKLLLCISIFLLGFSSVYAVTIFGMNFTQEGSGTVSLLNPGLQMEAYNNSTLRLKSDAALPTGDFVIELSGTTSLGGSYLYSHVKHFFGIVQFNETANVSTEQIISWDTPHFTADTHYRVDINTEIGMNQAFDVRFTRSGNAITTAKKVSGIYQTINTYTIDNTSKPLYFEFIQMDGTSGGSGYARYTPVGENSLLQSSVPEPTGILLVISGLLLLSYFTKKTQK